MMTGLPSTHATFGQFMVNRLIHFLFLIAIASLARADRPHVVMAFADDWGKHAGAYAKLSPGGMNDLVKTPNFDNIAAEGLLFTRAFVSAPSCTPCRSALFSGQHFWMCGRAAILLGAVWDGSNPAYPLILEQAGYRIGHTYKAWGPGTPGNAPHGGGARAFNSHGFRFNTFSQQVLAAEDRRTAQAAMLQEVRLNIRSFLDADNDGKLDGDASICYWFGPHNCHRQWAAGSGRELWGIDPDELIGKLPSFLPDVPIVRQDVADYLGEVQAFDAAVGVLVEELQRIGIDDNTLLVVSGDHGFPGVTHGKCDLYDFGTQVPLAIRWPAGIKHPGRVIDDFVSLPDLAPTFLEVAAVDRPQKMIAKSLVNIFQSDRAGQVDPSRDAVFTGRERHVATARTDNLPYPMRAIRTDQHLYIINFAPDRWPMGVGPAEGETPSFEALADDTFVAFADMDASPTKAWIVTHADESPEFYQLAFGRRGAYELYDIQSDPHCADNLADKPSHANIRSQLHQRLISEMTRTSDPRVAADVIFEKPPFTDAVGPARRRGKR
jgi:arylsulfatase A-like enzyme